jgi:hypothetical protein
MPTEMRSPDLASDAVRKEPEKRYGPALTVASARTWNRRRASSCFAPSGVRAGAGTEIVCSRGCAKQQDDDSATQTHIRTATHIRADDSQETAVT